MTGPTKRVWVAAGLVVPLALVAGVSAVRRRLERLLPAAFSRLGQTLSLKERPTQPCEERCRRDSSTSVECLAFLEARDARSRIVQAGDQGLAAALATVQRECPRPPNEDCLGAQVALPLFTSPA
jgi:hypothetical protein